jgi:hypothetical protein
MPAPKFSAASRKQLATLLCLTLAPCLVHSAEPAVDPRPDAAETTLNPPLQAELLAILEEDQKYRLQIEAVEKQFGRTSPEMKDLWKVIGEKDAANLMKVKAILDQHGWLGPDQVGGKASNALFLVIQHADLKTQQHYLPMMREAVKAKKAKASSLALLEDRVALGENRRQIYGSQIRRDNSTGKYYLAPLEDPESVDERRAAMGLGRLADYLKRWDIAWDIEAYKQELAQRESAAAKK